MFAKRGQSKVCVCPPGNSMLTIDIPQGLIKPIMAMSIENIVATKNNIEKLCDLFLVNNRH